MNRRGAVLSCFALCGLVFLTVLSAAESSGPLTQGVDPFLGAIGGGNTVPDAAVPFGFVHLSPDTTNADTSGYSSLGQAIGFSRTHVNGTRGDDKYGDFRVTPTLGVLRVRNLRFSKTQEQAFARYYSVVLGGDGGRITCELTATRPVRYQRFTFPSPSLTAANSFWFRPDYDATNASGRIGAPVAPRIFRGAATNRNSRTPAAANSSRLRHSMIWMPLSTSR